MAIELVVALAIIIGLSEVKEWRAYRRAAELEEKVNKIQESVHALNIAVQNIGKILESFSKSISTIDLKQDGLSEQIEDMKELTSKTEVQTATILREYELNGTPLGYIRKQPDFVEGL